jgi:hypothetical protein
MNKISVKLIILSLVLSLVTCQPSAADIEKAISQTQTALPTPTTIPTPTIIPLKDINLSEIMFLPGDLPSGFEPGQIRLHGNEEYEIGAINMFHQDLTYHGEASLISFINPAGEGGTISVYIYETSEQALSSYLKLANSIDSILKPQTIPGLGERAVGFENKSDLLSFSPPYESTMLSQMALVTFVRCNAMVEARLNLSEAFLGLIDYAKRLDERLIKLVCQ